MKNRVNLQLNRQHLRAMLRSIDDIIRGQKEKSVDVNVVTGSEESTNYIQFYVNRGSIEVSHKLYDEGDTKVEFDADGKFIFTTKVLNDIISKAKSDELDLRFSENNYTVAIHTQGSFSTPVSLDLPLVNLSEFKPQLYPDSLPLVADVRREELWETLGIMQSVSSVIDIKVTSGELWWYVSDIVDGEGKAMTYTVQDCQIGDVQYTYNLAPIINFVKSSKADTIELEMKQDGLARFKSQVASLESHLTLTPKIDSA